MQPTILLVNGDRETREIYRILLEHNGFRVAEATDPPAALELIWQAAPAAVVQELDFEPEIGLDLIAGIKNDPVLRQMPVIVITSHVLHRDRAVDAGCDEFLEKPCPPRRMLAAVRRLLGLTSTRDEQGPSTAPKPQP